MANLPEKNVVLVDKITNVPTDSNLFINANGEFKQASVNDVVNSSTVVSTAVETAINTAVQDSIDSNFKQTSGSPILLTDSAEGVLTDFKAYGKSIQDGEPTPDSPVDIKSVADCGYFDGELLQGYYNESGTFTSNTSYVCSKNLISCNGGDKVKIVYAGKIGSVAFNFYDKDMNVLSRPSNSSEVTEYEATSPTNAKYVHFMFREVNGTITPQTAKHITVTINGKYALIVKKINVNLFDKDEVATWDTFNTTFKKKTYKLKANTEYVLATNITEYGIIYLNTTTSFIGTTRATTDNNGELYIIVKQSEISASEIMLCESTHYNGTHIPHEHDTTYIPLNEPLRSNLDGSVKDEVSLSENKVTRRIVRKRIVTVSKNNSTDVNNYCYYCALGNVGRSNGGISNNLPNLLLYEVTTNGTENIGQYVSAEYGGVVYINVGKHLTENTVEGMTKWLSENPTYIQYELAEPITETIEPVDIVTYDNVTYLTASDNADMEIEYPTTKVAGIASIGYSKGIKAEYETEQLKKQLLEIQATIVNTL